MDLITWFWKVYVNLCGSMGPATFCLIARLYLITGLCFLAMGAAYRYGNRTTFAQLLAAVFGLLVATSISMDGFVAMRPVVRAWFIALGGVVIGYLPAYLPFLLVRKRGLQSDLRVIFYVLLGSILVLHLFVQCCRALFSYLERLAG
jgi:hypothetical protein